MRLQVFLSRSGVCSRRRALELIEQGMVSVDGQVITEASFSVDSDKHYVSLGQKKITLKSNIYILLNKPKGVTSTRADKYAKVTVMNLLPARFRHLHPVGRLDKDSEGLLLLTNDGDLTHKLSHPKFNVDKTYAVGISGRLKNAHKVILERGVFLKGKKTRPCRIAIINISGNTTRLRITLHEGKKRQIRRMFSSLGYAVVWLKRLSEGPLNLGGLKSGQCRLLTKKEITGLFESLSGK